MTHDAEVSSFAADPLDGGDAVAAAFDRMGRRVAGLAAAVEGFAARQQEIYARDYGDDLARIREGQEAFRNALRVLDQRPAMRLTVEGVAADIAKAGETSREADHRALTQAQRELLASAQRLDNVVTGRIDLRRQSIWIATAAGVLLTAGMIVGDVFPAAIARAMPESWHWPERRAAADLDMSGVDAAQRLYQVYDPAGWRALAAANRLVQANAATIAACQARASGKAVPVACPIIVSPVA